MTTVYKIDGLNLQKTWESVAIYPEWISNGIKENYTVFEEETTREEYEKEYNKNVPEKLFATTDLVSTVYSDSEGNKIAENDGFEFAKDIKLCSGNPSYRLTEENIEKYIVS